MCVIRGGRRQKSTSKPHSITCPTKQAYENQLYTASNGRKIPEWWVGKDTEGSSGGLIDVMSRILPRAIGE
jgi:hypothetical protein